MMQFPAGELAGVTLAVLDHPLRVAAGDAVRVRVSIANHSRATMGEFRFFTPHQMFLGGVWSDPNNKGLTPDSSLTLLWRPIRPGEHLLMHARVVAPRVPGRYKLWIMLVQNGVRWYDSNTEVKPVALDVEVCETLPVLPHSINDYEDCVYSQNGEDGIVRELFLRLGYSDPYAVEFGVGDGMECIAAYWMRQYGWRGLLIEGNPDDFARARNNYREFPGVTVAQAYVTLENILELFRRYKVPTEFDRRHREQPHLRPSAALGDGLRPEPCLESEREPGLSRCKPGVARAPGQPARIRVARDRRRGRQRVFRAPRSARAVAIPGTHRRPSTPLGPELVSARL
jgi:hypothetical protein